MLHKVFVIIFVSILYQPVPNGTPYCAVSGNMAAPMIVTTVNKVIFNSSKKGTPVNLVEEIWANSSARNFIFHSPLHGL